jgi:electron transfer flavoprotein alpha subunit
MNKERDILILLESFDEDCEEINRSLSLEGKRISTSLGGRLAALSIGKPLEKHSKLADAGISLLYILKNDLFSEYRQEVFCRAITNFLQKFQPRLFLLCDSDMGKELAPSIAHRLESVAVTDCVDIEVNGERLFYIKPVYGGQFEERISFPVGSIEIATIRQEALDKGLRVESNDIEKDMQNDIKNAIEVVAKKVSIPPEIIRTKPLERIPPDFRTTDIVHAKRIIGTGAGSADKQLIAVVEEFAELLQGSLGATRPVVDDGYLPKDRMIGQTGKMVAPEVYVSLGISGSPHHVAGIQEAEKIISVNKDSRAPIFQLSDIGFIADLKTILPKLVKRIKEWKER